MWSLFKFYVLSVLMYVSLYAVYTVDSARILGVFHVPSLSHQVVFQPIWKELSLRGHEVIVVTPNPLKDKSIKNLTEIDVSDIYQILQSYQLQNDLTGSIRQQLHNLFDSRHKFVEHVMNNKNFQKILNDKNQHFDLILYESTYPLMLSLSHRFKAPIIGISSLPPLLTIHDILGNPSHPVTHSDVILGYYDNLSFWERWFSTYHSIYYRLYHYFYILPKCDSVARKYFGTDIPYIGDLEKNVDMIFSSSNPLINSIRPTSPAFVDMRFMQIQPKKPLPKDLQEILDEASEGVIYLSFGSNLKSINLDKKLRNLIIGALSKLPYKIIWKWESDYLPGKPDNVVIRKWLPQQDILGEHKFIALNILDLQEILDEASEGVIYLSFGSNLKSINLDKKLRNLIIGALSKLPYKIIWKWESDYLPGKPDNVVIRKWLPQQDILGHPNVKAFVSQGGLQSLEETIVNAVPVVGIPFIYDQPSNMAKIASHGFGIALNRFNLTKDELTKAIIEVAENKKYRKKIEELRVVLLDEPMTGVEKAVWWAEYVIRHKGGKHLRSATLNIPLYQYFLLDVIAATLAVILISTYLTYKVTKLIIHFTSRNSNKLKQN